MIRALPWSEIENVDFESDHEARTALWRIPAQRMKLVLELKSDQGYEHIVPLASQAVAVLMRVGEFLRTLVMQACDTGLGESQTERQLARIETDQCFAAVALDALLAGHPDPDMRSRAHAAFIRKTERRRRLEASGEGTSCDPHRHRFHPRQPDLLAPCPEFVAGFRGPLLMAAAAFAGLGWWQVASCQIEGIGR